MFRCDGCGRKSAPREPMTKVVIETRPKTYTYQGKSGYQEISYGHEIVKEGKYAPCCATAAQLASLKKGA